MEQKTLEEIIEGLPKRNSFIILIEDDFSEGIYRIEQNIQELPNLIRCTRGYCCIQNNIPYSFWNFNPDTEKYEYYEGGQRKEDLYLHDKVTLKLQLNDNKIPYKEDKP